MPRSQQLPPHASPCFRRAHLLPYPTLPALVALRAEFLPSVLDPGNVLPELRGELPAGTGASPLVAFEIAAPSLALPPKADLLYPMDPLPAGGKTPRPTWPEGKLTSIVQIDKFKDQVAACTSPILLLSCLFTPDADFSTRLSVESTRVRTVVESLPGVGIPSHPACPFPHLVSAARSLNLYVLATLTPSVRFLCAHLGCPVPLVGRPNHPSLPRSSFRWMQPTRSFPRSTSSNTPTSEGRAASRAQSRRTVRRKSESRVSKIELGSSLESLRWARRSVPSDYLPS